MVDCTQCKDYYDTRHNACKLFRVVLQKKGQVDQCQYDEAKQKEKKDEKR